MYNFFMSLIHSLDVFVSIGIKENLQMYAGLLQVKIDSVRINYRQMGTGAKG